MSALIYDAVRTPIGRYGGALAGVRPDDLAAMVIKALVQRNKDVEWSEIDDVVFGCANQAGEDNRNVARMAGLLADLPVVVPGVTVNRLCASGLDAVGIGARSVRSGDCSLMITGGVESMSRAPFVMPKAEKGFDRNNAIYDTTIGWRFVNKKMKDVYGVDSMPQTADNVAVDFDVSRLSQDEFALRSQQRWKDAYEAGVFADEIIPVTIPQRKGDALVFDKDEHPRPEVTLEKLGKLRGVNGPDNSVTAGNSSGVNDGAAALLIGDETLQERYGLTPKAEVLAVASGGVEPRVMGVGPVPAVKKVLKLTGLSLSDMDVIELNEAFAAQALAVLRELGIADDAEHVNPNGGAIAIGHPLGMSGTRLVVTALNQLHRTSGKYALCTMCVGVGQGVALVLKRL